MLDWQTLCYFLYLGDNLTWVVDAYGIFGIHRLQAVQKVFFHLKASQQLPQHFMRHNIERLFEIHKATIEWLLFCLVLFY
jgi:hypothetical protein